MISWILRIATAALVAATLAGVWRWIDPQPVWVIALVALELLVVFVYGFKAAGRRYWNILIAIDFTLNAWAGGDPSETISSRAAKQAHKRGWRILGRFLDAIDPGHMARAIIHDRGDKAAWD